MTNRLLEKKINRLEKDLAFVKRLVLAGARKTKKVGKKEALSNWAIKQIRLGQEDVKTGRTYSMGQVKKKYRLSGGVDREGEYNPNFVKRVLKNAKDRRGSVVYTNKRDFLKLISK